MQLNWGSFKNFVIILRGAGGMEGRGEWEASGGGGNELGDVLMMNDE